MQSFRNNIFYILLTPTSIGSCILGINVFQSINFYLFNIQNVKVHWESNQNVVLYIFYRYNVLNGERRFRNTYKLNNSFNNLFINSFIKKWSIGVRPIGAGRAAALPD